MLIHEYECMPDGSTHSLSYLEERTSVLAPSSFTEVGGKRIWFRSRRKSNIRSCRKSEPSSSLQLITIQNEDMLTSKACLLMSNLALFVSKRTNIPVCSNSKRKFVTTVADASLENQSRRICTIVTRSDCEVLVRWIVLNLEPSLVVEYPKVIGILANITQSYLRIMNLTRQPYEWHANQDSSESSDVNSGNSLRAYFFKIRLSLCLRSSKCSIALVPGIACNSAIASA